MRFVWAVLAFIVAAVMIGAGIAQRTIFQGPPTQSAQIETASATAAYTVIDGAVLTQHPGAQTLAVRGTGTVFAAYGRTADVDAWVADVPHTAIGVDGSGAVTSTLVAPTASTTQTPAKQAPSGSDLWVQEFTGTSGNLSIPMQVPASMSVVVASDGTAPAPATVTVTWPADNATPWAGPLFLLGGLFLIGGVVLYILGIRHARRSRGPRRKGPPPLPKTEPISIAAADDEAAGDEAKGVVSTTPSRRSLSSRRSLLAVPVLIAASAVALTGCSAEVWPQFGAASVTPSPTASVIDAESQQAPAVTEAQAQDVLARIAKTVADADSSRGADTAATRLAGAMLAERQTNYTLRGAVPDAAALPPIATTPLSVVLPQAYSGWPRTVMLVVGDANATNPPPTIMMMTQADPWSNYKLDYAAGIEAGTQLPGVAPVYVGAKAVPPDSTFLLIPPGQLAAAYSDVINNGANSKFATLFDDQSDQFRPMVAADRQKRLNEFNATGANTGNLSFSSAAGSQSPLALATLESGAIVAVNVNEIDTVKPTDAAAVIKLDNNPTVKALAGADQSQSGFTTTFSDQLFFYVPGQGSNEKIQLLGYSSNILGAKVIQ
ncbi:glycosyl transferase [Microbacterium sp. X-17]|uniref:glycosyl transferase n=1 Tax=Microbacterium sp. X-17 TaxID=3144404 RepID=UPI0031F594B5